jgi:serine protease
VKSTRSILLLSLLLLSSAGTWAAGAAPNGPATPAQIHAQTLLPRPPAPKGRAFVFPAETEIGRVVVKFHEGTHVRLRSQQLVALERDERERAALAARGLDQARVTADLAAVHGLVAREALARGLARLFKEDEQLLATRRATGEAKGGRELADLDLYFEVPVPEGTTYAEVEAFVARLDELASVEVAYAQPVPETAQTGTPNLQPEQGYLNPASAAPQGVDAFYAWTFAGGRGQGVRIVDVEFAWRVSHEDFPAFFYQGGTQSTSVPDRDHGTAVVGEMVARDNGFGVTGIANQAQIGYHSTFGITAAAAINAAAIAAGSPNGVVLIELHQPGPATPNSPCGCSGRCDYVPMEHTQAEYDAIATATANGTVVVEAGGNGATNLDDPVYGNLFNRSVRDSGAILVGASESNSRTPTCFTNFGSRIDVHGWGENVVTTGYGDRFTGGTPDREYTAVFNGTSSASPIVTGAVADIQGKVIADRRGALAPRTIRQLLRDTGTPQVADPRQIGPLPDLRRAINGLAGYYSFEGYFDGATCQTVWGWAWDRNRRNTPIYVDIYRNNVYYTSALANLFRQDLLNAGIGNGSHAFSYNLPYATGQYSFNVRFPSTNTSLSGTNPRTIYCGFSIFTTQTPAEALSTAGTPYEVGNQISSSVDGRIKALKFHKAPGEAPTSHTIRLWSDAGGPPIATATTFNETASGWQTATLQTPVSISANVRYRVTVTTSTVQSKTGCGLSTPISNGPLTAHQGYWIAGSGVFPTNSSCSNFWTDVVFDS